ncbi:MAG: glycosyl transferase family 2, partial [Candidatus Dormibacteria bacterium]
MDFHSLLAMMITVATNPVTDYLRKLTNRTFSGIYQPNTFDLLMMIPYFLVLGVLAAYGIYRYVLVYNFYHYRHNVPGTPPPVKEWPKVTIQLPIYNERY